MNPLLLGRCVIGGILMGLANLVPGISGGTMLLAAGVYPTFVESVAELDTVDLRLRCGTPAASASCGRCTLLNDAAHPTCDACDSARPQDGRFTNQSSY